MQQGFNGTKSANKIIVFLARMFILEAELKSLDCSSDASVLQHLESWLSLALNHSRFSSVSIYLFILYYLLNK